MKAVNLVPADARRGRGASGNGAGVSLGTFGAAQFFLVLLVIVVAIVLLRVLADNNLNNKQATLAALDKQVLAEQTQASQLSKYVTFVHNIEQTEQQVTEIAQQRFPWRQTLDQISHVLPATTSLTSLMATTGGSATSSTGETSVVPVFTLNGCATTPNQNGVATLLRRLTQVSGVTNVGFSSSTRQTSCGNSFDVTLTFVAPGSTAASSAAGSASTAPTTTTAPASTTTTTTGAG